VPGGNRGLHVVESAVFLACRQQGQSTICAGFEEHVEAIVPRMKLNKAQNNTCQKKAGTKT